VQSQLRLQISQFVLQQIQIKTTRIMTALSFLKIMSRARQTGL
jgi:hypothetical protein